MPRAQKHSTVLPVDSWLNKCSLIRGIAYAMLLSSAHAQSLESLGNKALADHLPEIAAMRFQEALKDTTLDKNRREKLLLLLAESQIRAGQPTECFKTLSAPQLAEHPERLYWLSMVQLNQGLLQNALSSLQLYLTKANISHKEEALITKSRIHTLLGDLSSAVETLKSFTNSNTALSRTARIDLAEMLMELGDVTASRNTLPPIALLKNDELIRAKILNAQILLEDKHYQDALASFESVLKVKSEEEQSLPASLHKAVIGKATALSLLKNQVDATDTLLAFIQQNPTSPLLAEVFPLLANLIPDEHNNSDPVITHFMQWSKLDEMLSYKHDLFESDNALSPHFQNLSSASELQAQALYYLAQSYDSSTPENLALKKRLFTLLRFQFPAHPLVKKSYLSQAESYIAEHKNEDAINLLNHLRLSLSDGDNDKNLATRIEILLAKQDTLTENFKDAATHFAKITELLPEATKNTARYNQALSELLAQNFPAFEKIKNTQKESLFANLELEQALFTVRMDPTEAMKKLESFVAKNPDHPRKSEAILACAHCAISQTPVDQTKAQSFLDLIKNDASLADQVALLQIRVLQNQSDLIPAISACKKFVSDFPQSPEITKVQFLLGQLLFRNGNLNEARIVLTDVSKSDSEFTAPALLLSARAASRTGTPQTLQEAITLFDTVAQKFPTLATYAMLEKASSLIEQQTPEALRIAIADLSKLLPKLNIENEDAIYTSTMLAEAQYALGGTDAKTYPQTLVTIDKILSNKKITPSQQERITYLRGLTLEKMLLTDEALNQYYSIIELATIKTPTLWDYVERSGFNALSILEKKSNWPAAIALAKKLSTLHSPRAKEAAERAKNLSLEHMVWDD